MNQEDPWWPFIGRRSPQEEKWVWPSGDWPRIRTIDMHTEGEPLRVIVSGFPVPDGSTVLERRGEARQRYDSLRRSLMWEPRGHADMYGCLVMPPTTEEADFAVLFLHNEGYSTMCGHGIIGVTKLALESGWVGGGSGDGVKAVAIDTPAGLVRASASVEGGRVHEVGFVNVPSFAGLVDREVDVAGVGRVQFDIGYGGAFYAYVDATSIGLSLVPDQAGALIEAGRAISSAVAAAYEAEISHPGGEDLGFLYGTVFVGPAQDARHHSRHVCIFAEGELDRSPTGTAVSGRLALLYTRDQVTQGETIFIESIIGGRFSGRILETTSVGDMPAVIPEVGGRAWVTGRHEFVIDSEDPWGDGFILR